MHELILKAKEYATSKHNEINHKYGDEPYYIHLEHTYNAGLRFIHLINEDQSEVLAACWIHDLLEDTHETFNNIKNKLNENLAEYSYRLATEKGRSRSERANEKYYKEIKEYKHAVFVKLCDRIANTNNSKIQRHKMFEKYKKEFKHFKDSLYDGRYEEMWKYLEDLYYE